MSKDPSSLTPACTRPPQQTRRRVTLEPLGGQTAESKMTTSPVLGGVGVNGKLLILGAPHEPLSVPVYPLLAGRRSVAGWSAPPEAYELMMSGKARFRVVLLALATSWLPVFHYQHGIRQVDAGRLRVAAPLSHWAVQHQHQSLAHLLGGRLTVCHAQHKVALHSSALITKFLESQTTRLLSVLSTRLRVNPRCSAFVQVRMRWARSRRDRW